MALISLRRDWGGKAGGREGGGRLFEEKLNGSLRSALQMYSPQVAICKKNHGSVEFKD